MKKSIKILTIITIVISMLLTFTFMATGALVAPTDFKTLDNFDGYANNAALTTAGYATYAYGNLSTTIEITSTGAKSGKALKVSNAAAAERLDFTKQLTNAPGALGISFWVNNISNDMVSLGPLLQYNYMNVGAKYFVRADGATEFVETDPLGNQWFPIQVAAGEKIEVAIPFASFATTYEWTDPLLIMSVWGVASLFNVVFDNIKLYGVDDPDVIPTEPVSESSESSESAVSESAVSESEVSESEGPQTSDNSNAVMVSVLFLFVSGCILVISKKRKISA